MTTLIDLVGLRFGRLTVLRFHDRHGSQRQRRYLCRCDCGSETIVWGRSLRDGHTQSCGCLMRERVSAAHRRHGHAAGPARERKLSPTYRSWASMIARCKSNAPNTAPYYKQRGITVCERWHSFDNFLADMGERPSGTTIDRIDNDRGYEPGNCRWATPKQQRANRRQ